MTAPEIEAHRHTRGPVRKRHRRWRKGFDMERITDDLDREEVPPCAPSEQQPNGGV
jgi:hypothetical protein